MPASLELSAAQEGVRAPLTAKSRLIENILKVYENDVRILWYVRNYWKLTFVHGWRLVYANSRFRTPNAQILLGIANRHLFLFALILLSYNNLGCRI